MATTALLIDDEPDILELLDITLSRMGITSRKAETLKEAKALLAQHKFQFCLTDMRLPDGNGIELVKQIQVQMPELPVAVLTAHGNVDTAIEAMKAGAYDFLSKPVDLEQLRQLVTNAVSTRPNQAAQSDQSSAILGQAPCIDELRRQINKVARSQAPVFISGESGTGKELVAKTIHEQGARSRSPFIAVNCGAIPSELMESEFFGHRKGSFTGATADKDGLFQAAHGGTLFLDEVADLPLEMQVKLLRVIQEKSVRAIGDVKETKIDVRILSASHKSLQNAVANGSFRSDLFYRINVIEIQVPPLRARGHDVLLLAERFLQSYSAQNQQAAPKLSASAQSRLLDYGFPGNVRELNNILERAYTLCNNSEITDADLNLYDQPTTAPAEKAASPDFDAGYDGSLPLDDYLANIEREILLATLDKHRWNRTAAARDLGMTLRSIRYRLKKLGIDSDEPV